MKKIIFLLLVTSFSFSLFSQNVAPLSSEKQNLSYTQKIPELLSGIWQGKDRLIFFNDQAPSFSLILRVFYTWYDDRASEPASYSQLTARSSNDTTTRNAEYIQIKYKTLVENKNKTSGAYELELQYSSTKEKTYIPICVIDNKLYLNFFLKSSNFNSQNTETATQNNTDSYYLVEKGTSSGIKIIPPLQKKELLSYVVDGNNIYHIRYWLSNMENDNSMAEFTDEKKTFFVDKYITSGGNTYTCTTGRSSKIRNIQKSFSLDENIISDEEKIIFAKGEPYLLLAEKTNNPSKYLNIAEEQNKKRAPLPPPPFPPSQINFHWKEISELEKYNPYTWNKRNLDIHK